MTKRVQMPLKDQGIFNNKGLELSKEMYIFMVYSLCNFSLIPSLEIQIGFRAGF